MFTKIPGAILFSHFQMCKIGGVPPIQLQLNGTDGRGDWLVPVVIVVTVLWLATLWHLLARSDFEPITRLTWVVVVIFVPIFGIFFYWGLASSSRMESSKPRRSVLDHPASGTPWENDPAYRLPRK